MGEALRGLERIVVIGQILRARKDDPNAESVGSGVNPP